LGHINLALQWYASLYNDLSLLEKFRVSDLQKLTAISNGFMVILLEAKKQKYAFSENDANVKKETEYLFSYFEKAGLHPFLSPRKLSDYIGKV
jgi:hypothetical protein